MAITAASLGFGQGANFMDVPELTLPAGIPGGSPVPISQFLAGIGPAQQSKWGGRLQNLGTGVQALSGLAGMYLGFKANKLASEDLKFQKAAYRDRLEGATKAYNSAVDDRGATRAAVYGDPSYAASYIEKNRLTPKGI